MKDIYGHISFYFDWYPITLKIDLDLAISKSQNIQETSKKAFASAQKSWLNFTYNPHFCCSLNAALFDPANTSSEEKNIYL